MGCTSGKDPLSAAKTTVINTDLVKCDNHDHPVKTTQQVERLAKNTAYEGGWWCNGCSNSFPVSLDSYSCVPCEFDLCRSCKDAHKVI
mmetsp:Transcript_26379/g.25544  ORF Transcript_26379/g.25544 Transcript_26379/m.25544 type:complete len:88 (-) Transcript_26379:25-288(-)